MRKNKKFGTVKLLAALLSISAVYLTVVGAARADEPDGLKRVKLPVLMYHSVLNSEDKQGKYVIPAWLFEADLKYLSSNGYTSVTPDEVIAYVENGAPLPEKPVMLTFDDGHYNCYYYCDSLLKKYNMKAVMFVIGMFSERSRAEGLINPSYSYVTPVVIGEMSAGGVWDIQSHCNEMHKYGAGERLGMSRLPGESEEHYETAIRADITWISEYIERYIGRAPVAFAYPFGATDELAERVLCELGYKLTVCSYEGVSEVIRGDLSSLRLMRRIPRNCGSCLAEWLQCG
jgi:peptidoglycan/xylan/chitin deacetylase (PgdA/CDA1 family)